MHSSVVAVIVVQTQMTLAVEHTVENRLQIKPSHPSNISLPSSQILPIAP